MYENYIERKAKGLIEISSYTQVDKDEKEIIIPAIINKRFTTDGDEYFQKSPVDTKVLDDKKAELQALIADIDQLKIDITQ